LPELDGQIALVTGGGRGIGANIARELASAGARVAVSARTREQVEAVATEIGGLAVVGDVSDADSVDAMVREVESGLGPIDVLCANAGIELPRAPAIDDVTDDEWDRLMAVNVTGTFLVTRAAVPHIPDGGAVVTIGSINSFVGWPNDLPYTTSKAAVLGFTRALALDLAPRRIRANCVCPGIIDTPLTRAFIDAAPDPDDVVEEYEAAAPLGRMGTAEEVANAALFLASDEASFITGSALLVDGGTTAIA